MASMQCKFLTTKIRASSWSGALAAILLCSFCAAFSPFPALFSFPTFYSYQFSIRKDSSMSQLLLFQSQSDDSSDATSSSSSSSSTNNHALPTTACISGVTLKMAFDENWAVADHAAEQSERFTCPSSLDLVHRLRRECQGVLVGRGTVQRDNCTLTVRRVRPLYDLHTNTARQPIRIVVDPQLKLLRHVDNGATYTIFQDGLETIVYCSQNAASLENVVNNVSDKVTIVPLPTIKSNTGSNVISTRLLLHDLHNRGVHHIMVEGGPVTAISFLQDQLVDRAILIRAPIQFREPVISNITTETLVNAGLVFLGSCQSNGDCVEYWSRPNVTWPTNVLTDWP